ncbi:hypothetical protein [Candidatus Palauibacter sp.]|uniref:hypothetical protein n=1 Tax=Candidatus Palauibacter sp. TaxID=3101350 RepID=UPI003B026D5D
MNRHERSRKPGEIAKATLKELLLAPEARTDSLVPTRHVIRQRPTPRLDSQRDGRRNERA